MKSTTIQIDHREWKQWMDQSAEGAIGKLNTLLEGHGVVIEVLNDRGDDFLELRAVSLGETANASDLAKQIRGRCTGYPFAKIPWPHRILHAAADAADLLERVRKAWNNGVTKWRETHASIPTEFIELAGLMDTPLSLAPEKPAEYAGPKRCPKCNGIHRVPREDMDEGELKQFTQQEEWACLFARIVREFKQLKCSRMDKPTVLSLGPAEQRVFLEEMMHGATARLDLRPCVSDAVMTGRVAGCQFHGMTVEELDSDGVFVR